MVYCEVLLSTSTRGRELKNLQRLQLVYKLRSTSTRGRELKNNEDKDVYYMALSTSTRGRELKKQIGCCRNRRRCRPPREVVS